MHVATESSEFAHFIQHLHVQKKKKKDDDDSGLLFHAKTQGILKLKKKVKKCSCYEIQKT